MERLRLSEVPDPPPSPLYEFRVDKIFVFSEKLGVSPSKIFTNDVYTIGLVTCGSCLEFRHGSPHRRRRTERTQSKCRMWEKTVRR